MKIATFLGMPKHAVEVEHDKNKHENKWFQICYGYNNINVTDMTYDEVPKMTLYHSEYEIHFCMYVLFHCLSLQPPNFLLVKVGI